MHSGQYTTHAVYIHVCNQGIYQGKSIVHTQLKGRICNYILVSFLHLPQQGETSASGLLALPYDIKIGGFITKNTLSQYEHDYHIISTSK